MDDAFIQAPCSCGQTHRLDGLAAREAAKKLMDKLAQEACLDFELPSGKRNPGLSLKELWGVRGEENARGRGRMFGVLLCRDARSRREVSLKAFSGNYRGHWEIPGWAPPVFDTREFERLTALVDPEIKELGRRIREGETLGRETAGLKEKRRRLSGDLSRRISRLYRLTNFRGEEKTIGELFFHKIPPAGTGDCCAPKLLNWAAVLGYEPLSLAEFYWGRDSLSGEKSQGVFYSPCREKCGPLLGFLLCGTEERFFHGAGQG